MNLNHSSRRSFLRGVGACLALPAMQSLRPSHLLAAEAAESALATTATGAPLRTAFLFFPNGAIPKSWWPEQPGTDFAISPTLGPLAPFKNSLQIMKGLDQRNAEPGPDGGGDHARGNGTFLTGVRLNKSATEIRAGVSVDQVMASQIGHLTRFPSLELASDPVRQTSGCDSGYSCAYQYNISWQSEKTPMATENNPRLVFERLFGAGGPGERLANLNKRHTSSGSILDFVLEDASAMERRMQKSDKQKLDEYLTGVRELESRIEAQSLSVTRRIPASKHPMGFRSPTKNTSI